LFNDQRSFIILMSSRLALLDCKGNLSIVAAKQVEKPFLLQY